MYPGAKRNMKRGTGIWGVIVVLAVVGEHLMVWRGGVLDLKGKRWNDEA